MERLGEKLSGVTIKVQPWSDDSTPAWVQLQNLEGGG
jgi:hypothetical protein